MPRSVLAAGTAEITGLAAGTAEITGLAAGNAEITGWQQVLPRPVLAAGIA